MKLYIANGYIIDPSNNVEAFGDLLIEDGVIKEVKILNRNDGQTEHLEDTIYIDATGKWVVPGFIDIHVHLREPGFEYKEDIASGCQAAARGGFTTLCCMPNTNPVIDHGDMVSYVNLKAQSANGINVLPIGAMTKGQEGIELADYKDMVNILTKSSEMSGKGICGISEDGKTLMDEALMKNAMQNARILDLAIFSHAEPEEIIVERDIKIASDTGCRLHFCHISTKESLALIRNAIKQGMKITAETAPHYFTLNESDVSGDTNRKMNPPLRAKEDVQAVIEALKDGTIDIIATDHAPHHKREKNLPFEQAANGVTGLETSFAISYTNLVKTGILTPLILISKMSRKPAELLGIERGSLSVGKAADITIIDVEKEYVIDPSSFLSKSKNSPFLGMKVFGAVDYTICNGKILWKGIKDD